MTGKGEDFLQEFHLVKSTELCLQNTASKHEASFCIINSSPFPVYNENTIKCLNNLTTGFYFPISPHFCPHTPTPKSQSVILVFSHNQHWIHTLHVLICFIQPHDSVLPCDEECTPHCAVLKTGKGNGIYSFFNSPSKATTSQLQWQIKYSDRSITEVDNNSPKFSRVSNNVHSFSELTASKTASAQLLLWSGKARMTVLIV